MIMGEDGATPSMQEARGVLPYKLFLFSFLQGFANGIWGFLSIFLLDIGGSGIDVGILATVPGVASTFMQLAWGRVSDRLGRSWWLISTGFFLAAIFSFPVSLSNRPGQVILTTGLQALFSSMTGVAIVVRLAEILRPSTRARFMGIYNPMGFAGNIVGSFYAGFMIPHFGYRITFLSYTIVNFTIVALIKYGLQEVEEKHSYTSLIRTILLELNNGLKGLSVAISRGGAYTRWCLGIAIRGFGIAMFGPLVTVSLVQVFNASKPQIAALNSVAFTLRLLVSPPLGWVVDRKGPKRIMLVGIVLAILHPLLFTLPTNVTHLVPVYILSGLYWAFINASWFAWQMNLIPEERGLYAGFLNFINGLSWAFGPLLGGFLVEAASIQVSAIFSAASVLIGLSILLKVPNAQEEHFTKK